MTTYQAAKIRAVIVRACLFFRVRMCRAMFYPCPVPDGGGGCLLGTYLDDTIAIYGEPDPDVVIHEIAHHVYCCWTGEHRRYHTKAFYQVEREVTKWATDTGQF